MRNSFESFVPYSEKSKTDRQGATQVPAHLIERSEAAKARALETTGAPA